jgi:hypothetical protein
MANDQDRNPNPTTGTETDISKSQSQQQPAQSQQDEKKAGEPGQFETGQAPQQTDAAAEGQQGDTLAQQRTDVEGSSLGSEKSGEAASGFVGAEGKTDTSSELVEDEESDERRSDGE